MRTFHYQNKLMKTISNPTQLKQTFRIESLEPFGILIDGENNHSIETIDRSFLYRMALSEKIILLRNFTPLQKEEFHNFCLSFPNKSLLHWESGPIMEMKVTDKPTNYLFSNERVPFHWDGAFHTSPSFLMFQCIVPPAPNAGGETLFTQTELILKNASSQTLNHWKKVQLTYRTEKRSTTAVKSQYPWFKTILKQETLFCDTPKQSKRNSIQCPWRFEELLRKKWPLLKMKWHIFFMILTIVMNMNGNKAMY
jgi:alpha-ketoglutarate-dependent taurine dioxygenase